MSATPANLRSSLVRPGWHERQSEKSLGTWSWCLRSAEGIPNRPDLRAAGNKSGAGRKWQAPQSRAPNHSRPSCTAGRLPATSLLPLGLYPAALGPQVGNGEARAGPGEESTSRKRLQCSGLYPSEGETRSQTRTLWPAADPYIRGCCWHRRAHRKNRSDRRATGK